MIKHFLLLFTLFFVLGCKQSGDFKNKAIVQEDEKTITKSDISKLKYTDFVLDSKAQNLLKNWSAYIEISNAVNNVKEADFLFFKDNQELLHKTLTDLVNTVPNKIKTPEIEARIVAFVTQAYRFEDYLSLNNTSKNQTLELIKELLLSFTNITIQINKKIEIESQLIMLPN